MIKGFIEMSEKLLNILIVDDDKVDQMRLKRTLEKLLSPEMGSTVESAETLTQALDMLKTGSFDLVLLDLRLPDSVGLKTVDSVHQACPDMPIVVLTGSNDGQMGVETVKRGAIDYISKSFDQDVFETRIGIALHIVKLQEKLHLLANVDELTGLVNYRHFFDILEHEISRAKVTGDALVVIMFDIDHFKSLNDSYGHLGGDEILKQMGQILRENIYPLDVAARYGGDEFIVLMPGTSSTEALQATERLRGIIDRFEWKVSNQRISITASIGLANIDSDNLIDSHDLVEKADMALYTAKRRGRNCVVCWDKTDSEQKTETPNDRVYNELQTKVFSLRKQLRSYTIGAISSFTKAMDLIVKDPQMTQHAENVRCYAIAIAEEMGLSAELKERIGTAALLQDLGTITIPDHILRKTEPLTEEELKIVRQHPVAAIEILKPLGIFNLELQIIMHHHEKLDGTGYPNGLKGREIPIGARILAVADTFDAITSDGGYRSAKSCEDALSEILIRSGSQFDTEVVEVFQKAIEKHKSEWPLSTQNCLVDVR